MKDSSLPWTAVWLALCVAGSCFIFTFAPWSPCTAFPLRLPLLQSNVPVKPPFLCASYYTQTLTAKRHTCPSECYAQMWHKDTEDKIFSQAHWQALNPFSVKFLLQPLVKLQNPTPLPIGDVSLYQESTDTWKGVKEQQKTFHRAALNWLHRRLICKTLYIPFPWSIVFVTFKDSARVATQEATDMHQTSWKVYCECRL